MPLGQAPYGSRQTPRDPDGEDSRDSGGKSPGGRPGGFSWILWIPIVAMVAFVAANWGKSGKATPRGVAGPTECLTDKSCGAGSRCFAVPKDDPFVVVGECAQACEGDLQCPARHRCEDVAVGKSNVVPLDARGATAERAKICRPFTGDASRL